MRVAEGTGSRRGVEWPLGLLLVGLTLFALWGPRFLPLLDLPNHLAFIAVWARLDDPSWGYDRYYEHHRMPVPYWGYYLGARLLAFVVSVEAANKVVLTLYALALPLSVAAFARRFGRDPRPALLAFPLVFSFSFGMGFLSFCLGLPLVMFGLIAVDRALEKTTVPRLLLVFVLTLATYFMHVLPWALLGLLGLTVIATRSTSRRPAVATAGALGLSAVVSTVLAILSRRTLTDVGSVAEGISVRHEKLWKTLVYTADRISITWPDNLDAALLGMWIAALGAILVLGLRGRPWRELRRVDLAPEACVVVAFIAYLACPTHIMKPVWWWMVGPRLLTPVLLLLLALTPSLATPRARAALLLGAIAGAGYVFALTDHFLDFDARAKGIAEVMKQVPRGSSTLVVQAESGDPAVDRWYDPYAQFHSWAQILGGGYDPYMFHHGFPVRLRADVEPLPAPHFFKQVDFNYDVHGTRYDFIVTRGELRTHSMFRMATRKPPLVTASGEFRLYATGAAQTPK